MNTLFRWGGLAVWSLLGLLAGGCDDSADREDVIWDFVNPSVVFCVRDAATGADLLDPDAPGTLLGPSAAVVYRGVRYEVVKSGLPFASQLQTRYNPPHELGLRLYKVPSDPEHYRLAFGEFSPAAGLRDQELTVEWGDGSASTVRFDLYVTWHRNEPTVHCPIWLDGERRPGDGYAAWRIDLRR